MCIRDRSDTAALLGKPAIGNIGKGWYIIGQYARACVYVYNTLSDRCLTQERVVIHAVP